MRGYQPEFPIPDDLPTLATMGSRDHDATELISATMGRIAQHDPARLNAVAGAVSEVLGFTLLSRRYSIAILALEALDGISHSASKGDKS